MGLRLKRLLAVAACAGCYDYPCRAGPSVADIGPFAVDAALTGTATAPTVYFQLHGTDPATEATFSDDAQGSIVDEMAPEVRLVFDSETLPCDTEFTLRARLGDADDDAWRSSVEDGEWVLHSAEQSQEVVWGDHVLDISIWLWINS